MRNVKKYTDDQILTRLESLPTFKGWKVGKYDVWIRSNEDAYNKFDDISCGYEVKVEGKRPDFIFIHSGTTNPGAQGLKNFDTKYGNKRCAVLVADVVVYDCLTYRKHRGEYYAYCQCKNLPYVWDDNKNEKSGDSDKIVEGENIGANNHAAGENSQDINGNSIACTVRNVKKEFNEMMAWMNGDKYQTRIILSEW